jgi:VanZ like family
VKTSGDLSAFIGRWPALYAVAYFVVAVLLATLAPFDFHWLSAGTWPAWRANVSDIAQNILLFLPLGLILAQIKDARVGHALVLGLILSASVEFAQLSLIGRSSNFVDIVTNTNGALAGWIYGHMLRRSGVTDAAGLVFSLMILPLCWVIAMRTDREELLCLLIIPAGLAALGSFKASLRPTWLRSFHMLVWLGMALLPLLYMSRWATRYHLLGLPFSLAWICIGVVVSTVLLLPVEKMGAKLQSRLLVGVLAVFAVVDVLWFQAQGVSLRWTAHVHLHWAIEVICVALLLYAFLWHRRICVASNNV